MDCPDLLSELALDIKHAILALVPIRDAVKTSILSRQWRNTWTSLPHLVFDKRCANGQHKSRSEIAERMKHVITHVLLRHEGPIHKFKVYVLFGISWPDMDGWIQYLSRNDVKEISLDMPTSYIDSCQPVHSSLYSCEKLTKLGLSYCKLVSPPLGFRGFSFLKCLYLDKVDLSTDGIERLVAKAPLLETFELSGNEDGSSELSISAPNLKIMYLDGPYTKICLFAPLLAEMAVLLWDDDFPAEHQQHEGFVCNYTNFLGGLHNLEKLSGDTDFAKYLSIGIEFCHTSLVFHRLKDIELNNVNFEDIKEISVLVRLIMGAPKLHKLRVSTKLDIRVSAGDNAFASHSEAPKLRLADFGWEPDFALEKLRVVVMENASGCLSEIEFMKFLLASSPVLETLSVSYLCTVGTEVIDNLRVQLLGCHGASASPKAKLMVRRGSV